MNFEKAVQPFQQGIGYKEFCGRYVGFLQKIKAGMDYHSCLYLLSIFGNLYCAYILY